MLTVGIPKEIKAREKRVGLTPSKVGALHRVGITILVEKGAGEESGFSDEDYSKSGAGLRPDAESIYAEADLIQKVKEPLEPEFPFLRRGQVLFCFLHLASPENRRLIEALVQSGVTAIGYETLELNGRLPILAPMSEIAGGLSALYAAFIKTKFFHDAAIVNRGQAGSYRLSPAESRFSEDLESLAASYPQIPRGLKIGKAAVFGGGVAGQRAAEVALSLDGQVSIVEKKEERRKGLETHFAAKADKKVQVLAPESLPESVLQQADIFIGSAHRVGMRAAKVLDEALLKKVSLKHKKIIMDIAIDQGGNFPEAHATGYDEPLYLDSSGNLRFSVPNIPSLSGRAASEALAEASFQYTIALAENFDECLRELPEVARAINVRNGEVVLSTLKETHPV